MRLPKARSKRRKHLVAAMGVACATAMGTSEAQDANRLAPLQIDPGLLRPPAAAPAVPVAPRSAPTATEGKLRSSPGTRIPRADAKAQAGGPESRPESGPVSIAADRISGINDVVVEAEGNVELRRDGQKLESDRLTYRQPEDELLASGNVRLTEGQDVVTGPELRLRLSDNTGHFLEPRYTLYRAGEGGGVPTMGSGEAERIDFEGEDHYRLLQATYSTCRGDDPDWYVKAGSISLDYQREVGRAANARLIFLDTPILYSPWLTFSLNNQRKSGFLAPSLATTTTTGLEVALPYFWAMAPNRDLTVTPRLMAKRGLQVGGEFRYLDFNYQGQVRGEMLPNDRVTNTNRSQLSITHAHNFGRGFTGSVDFNRVSDDRYFADLASRLAVTSQINLLRQGVLSYAGEGWSASIMAQRFQTLEDPALPALLKPYYRLPQLSVEARDLNLPGPASGSFQGEYVNFSTPDDQLAEGSRFTVYPQLTLPLRGAAYHLTPKLGVRSTAYKLQRQDATLAGAPRTISRSWPIASIDGGLAFERELSWAGQPVVQTLEPRLYYLYVPARDQSQIPVFDTGLLDLNVAQIFTENRYAGGDRVGDANQLTAAVTSRLIDAASGGEIARLLIGQLYYFKRQEVTLPGEAPRPSGTADLLLAASGRVLPAVFVDAAWQYSSHDNRSDRIGLGVRYQPQPGKVVNVAYRFHRDLIAPAALRAQSQVNQVDLSAQWPLGGNWHGIGRYNFSLADGGTIETIAGLEYTASCWAGRIVLHRFATSAATTSTGLYLQLELNGFANIGSNPLDVLRRTIPGYSRVSEAATQAPGRLSTVE